MTDQNPRTTANNRPIDSLRQTSPYINTHRGKTFVVWFSGETLESSAFTSLVHDLTLLSHLGIKLVLVHGMRCQIDAELERRQIPQQFGTESNTSQSMRVTSVNALPAITTAVGDIRCKLEAFFSTGLPNSPMSGAQITLGSGNFIVAKPYGVRDGIDYQHTGEIRKIRAQKIRKLLDSEMVVLLSPTGYSPTGEMLNLLSEDVAMQAAIALSADKLIYLHRNASHIDKREILATDPQGAANLTNNSSQAIQSICSVVDKAKIACRNGVKRSHIVDATDTDALLHELFTRDGSGLLINSGDYDNIRSADTNNVSGIMQLIKPLIDDGTLLSRTEQDLEREIHNFYIIEREGSVICCASLTIHEEFAELGCLAVHPDFRASGKATDMLDYLVNLAKQKQCGTVFSLSTRSGDWFQEQGFLIDDPASLPDSRQIESSRGSRVYTLKI